MYVERTFVLSIFVGRGPPQPGKFYQNTKRVENQENDHGGDGGLASGTNEFPVRPDWGLKYSRHGLRGTLNMAKQVV